MRMNRKGFTLVEIIVVLVIILILAAIAVPSMLGFIEHTNRSLCNINIQEMNKYYRHTALYASLHDHKSWSLTELFQSKDPDDVDFLDSIDCPSHGVYSVENNTIICSKHGKQSEEPVIPEGPTIPNTNISLNGSGWPTKPMFNEDGNYQFKSGEVFKYNEKYYIITKDFTIYKTFQTAGPDGIYGWEGIERYTGYIWPSTSELNGTQLKDVKKGDLYQDKNGHVYIYRTTGGWGPMPPESHQEQWFKIK